MTEQKQTTITKDAANKKIIVVKEFNASPADVWKAWTDSKLLDEWWAPKPWKANTKTMDFKEGGSWLYYMQGPGGEKQYCRVDYKAIDTEKSFTGIDAFCDEQGTINNSFPHMHWKCEFDKSATGTKVTTEITFHTEEDMNKIIEMGFEEGFTMAHGNLDKLLAK